MKPSNISFTPTRRTIGNQDKQPSRNKRTIVVLFLLSLSLTCSFFGYYYLKVSAEAEDLERQKLPNEAALIKALDTIIAKHNYSIGVAITKISNGRTITAGSADQFTAGSTTKLFTAAAYYHLVESGKATLEQKIGAWPASFQLHELISISDNDSWKALKDYVTEDGLVTYVDSLGIDYDEPNNSIAPAEMSKFLTKLYTKTILNTEHTQKILDDMQNTNVESMIPAVTPESIEVYHKYGLYDGTLADVAILSSDGASYAISIYTKNKDDSDDAARISVIREIAATSISHLFDGTTPLSLTSATSLSD